jgi:hypothetical protein
MKLSEHFELSEFVRSDYAIRHGIDNTPNIEVVSNLTMLCVNVLEPLRYLLNRPIIITSGYRCEELNSAIGGAKNSQHVKGEASDIIVMNMSVDDVFNAICDSVKFDQVIHEFSSWVHVSYAEPLRYEMMWAVKENGKTVYLKERPKNV